jgi:hypothetical protein
MVADFVGNSSASTNANKANRPSATSYPAKSTVKGGGTCDISGGNECASLGGISSGSVPLGFFAASTFGHLDSLRSQPVRAGAAMTGTAGSTRGTTTTTSGGLLVVVVVVLGRVVVVVVVVLGRVIVVVVVLGRVVVVVAWSHALAGCGKPNTMSPAITGTERIRTGYLA